VTAVVSWTDLGSNIPTNGSATIALDAAAFNCDYSSQIEVPDGANVVIHGNGAVLDAAQKGPFFYVNSGAALALDHLVLRNGKGGAIRNYGTLAVTYANFTSNSASNAYGGAISNSGTLTVKLANFVSNSADGAGAIHSDTGGIATISNTDFTSNRATTFNGGAICNYGTLIVKLANFSSNSARQYGGGAIYAAGTVTISSAVFGGNQPDDVTNNGAVNFIACAGSIFPMQRGSTIPVLPTCPLPVPAEQAAWVSLYDGTGGATQWTNCGDNRLDPCGCTWVDAGEVTRGVTCSADGQHILRL
jgi:predicted outer membrane repeat protein